MCSRGLHRSRKSRPKEGLIRTCIFQIENQSIVIPGFLPFPTSTCACVPFFCSITYLLDCSWTSIDIRLTMHCNAFLISQWCLLLILILFVKSKCLLYSVWVRLIGREASFQLGDGTLFNSNQSITELFARVNQLFSSTLQLSIH